MPTPAAEEVARPGRSGPTALLRARREWVFFATLWKSHPGLTAVWWALILFQGILPAVFVVAVGALVGAVADGDPLPAPLLLLGVVFVLMQVMTPLHNQVGSLLGEHVSDRLHDRLLVAAGTPEGVAHLEDRAHMDELTVARDFDLGMTGPPLHLSMGIIAGGLVEAVSGLAQAVVLAAYAWWAPLLVGGAWLSTHWLLRESSQWDRNTGEVLDAQRRAEYSYRLAVDSPAAKEIRLFGLASWLTDRFASERRTLVELRWHATRLRQKPMRWTVVVLTVSGGLFFWSLGRDAASGAIGLGQVSTFAYAAVGASALAFGGLNWALSLAADGVASVLRVEQAMSSSAEARAVVSGRTPAEGMPAAQIRFRDVTFTYPGMSAPVLDGLDLTVAAGSSLAVVGVNGAGKSTLVKLLCRLYDPVSGTIEVDGTDLRDLDLESWRRRTSAIFQDFIRYELSLKDNVASPGATPEEVRRALTTAGAADLRDLDRILSPGYSNGTDLSGGQWQRVALARVLCAVNQGAGVVVLDEPTAQLDVRGEAEVFDRVLEATRGCTTVLISHRFSTVRRADRICVVDRGRVVELGSHDELMALGGTYARLFDLQAARFNEEQDGADSAR
ncbi:ABC-type multidrug transport system fused ATPase/permease subunit [Nocardiopsis arvandica]|uniref:ABC-type multidrug transport system fused ATPase/permease subunit n=1 Tax=Nocardiopsis sinuspersici TaxID=501010 RepID=A0A7Z0BHY4_9ACTN|nr:ABC transporter ATP-binding protein [Nocardiopsis sinuspersici]NYH50475.1 ABC-type multidrug transport system fused ATPase/permease subunit [Nocardiopsis sinuspersici]